MPEPILELRARIRRLELMLVVALVVAILPWIALGFGPWKLPQAGDTLVASGLELRSPEGETLVRLSTAPHGGELSLMTPAGKRTVRLSSATAGGDLELSTREGGRYARLGPGTGGPALQLINAASKQIVYLGSETEGDGNLTLNSRDGHVSIALRNNDGHGGSVGLFRDEKHLLAFLGPGKADTGGLRLIDAEGRDYLNIHTDDLGQGYLEMTGAGESAATLAISKESGPHLTMRSSKDGSFASLVAGPKGGRWSLGDDQGRVRGLAGPTHNGYFKLEVYGANEHVAALMTDTGTGGFFQAFSRVGNPVFAGGCDDQDGSGIVSLSHADGQQVFVAGMSGDRGSGIINVRDLGGKMILRAP